LAAARRSPSTRHQSRWASIAYSNSETWLAFAGRALFLLFFFPCWSLFPDVHRFGSGSFMRRYLHMIILRFFDCNFVLLYLLKGRGRISSESPLSNNNRNPQTHISPRRFFFVHGSMENLL
jgi:hypothetical protein